MKRNSSILIASGIGIVIIILFFALYNNQESELDELEGLETNFNNSSKEVSEIDKKLDEIERKAAENYFEPKPREWITSGPFQIDRSEYLIGESVFIRIGGLEPSEKGQIAFLRNLNETHYSVYQTIPFDGTKKDAFNAYTTIRLSKQLDVCSIEDVIGEWTVVFRGTDYPNIKFEILDDFLPGERDSYDEPVC